MDYEKWAQRHGEVKILGLQGPSIGDLELAASHIVRSLQNSDTASQEGEVLYFFYHSISERGPRSVVGWRDILCVWNLLRQLIENRSAAELLQIFLERVLHFLRDYELAKLPAHGDPTKVFRSLFHLFKPQHLWDALEQVLWDLKEKGVHNLTLIIDLYPKASAWEGLIDSIRNMTAGLSQGYGAVRVLLSNLPKNSNLWQHQPSEILLEYDKERMGMYNTQIQPSLMLWAFNSCLRHWG